MDKGQIRGDAGGASRLAAVQAQVQLDDRQWRPRIFCHRMLAFALLLCCDHLRCCVATQAQRACIIATSQVAWPGIRTDQPIMQEHCAQGR